MTLKVKKLTCLYFSFSAAASTPPGAFLVAMWMLWWLLFPSLAIIPSFCASSKGLVRSSCASFLAPYNSGIIRLIYNFVLSSFFYYSHNIVFSFASLYLSTIVCEFHKVYSLQFKGQKIFSENQEPDSQTKEYKKWDCKSGFWEWTCSEWVSSSHICSVYFLRY